MDKVPIGSIIYWICINKYWLITSDNTYCFSRIKIIFSWPTNEMAHQMDVKICVPPLEKSVLKMSCCSIKAIEF